MKIFIISTIIIIIFGTSLEHENSQLNKRNCYEVKTCYECLNSEDPRYSSDGKPFGRCIPMQWSNDDSTPETVGKNPCEAEYIVDKYNLEQNKMQECLLPEPYDIDTAEQDDGDDNQVDDRFFIIRRDFSKRPIFEDERLSHSGLLLRIDNTYWIVEYLDTGIVNKQQIKRVCQNQQNDQCKEFFYEYHWVKQKYGKKIKQKISVDQVAKEMENLMSYSKFRLENHNSNVAQESIRLKLNWSTIDELTYVHQSQFNIKALNMERKPCYQIKKCEDCTKYIDSRKNEWPGKCLPVKNTKSVCEPESFIEAKGLQIKYECIKEKDTTILQNDL